MRSTERVIMIRTAKGLGKQERKLWAMEDRDLYLINVRYERQHQRCLF